MQTMKTRVLRLFAAVLCAVTLAASNPVLAVTQADINALKKTATQLDSKRNDLTNKIDELKDDKTQALKRKELLDERISNTQSQISNIEAQIVQYNQLIKEKEAELADAEAREAAQYELFCERVRAMEEKGDISYWSVLFRAESFTDLLSRLDYINEIMDADQRVIDDLKALQVEIAERKTDLEASRADSQAAKADLVNKKSELNKQRQEAIELVNEINSDQAAYQSTLDAVDAEEEAIQKRIVELSRKLAEEEAARRAEEARRAAEAARAAGQSAGGSQQTTATPATKGGYIWPVPSRKITSTMGRRNTGIKGASTNHKGVDIGGVGYTTQVRAAKAGTVIVSQRSSSYGNYVVVSHGSGNTTLYAHMSSRKVSVGQYVNQGDVLGITGSTGISSGAHLHFEITENGSRVNPLNYLAG